MQGLHRYKRVPPYSDKTEKNKTKLILMTKNEYRPFNNKTALHKIICVQKCQQNKNKAQFSLL